MLGEKLSKSFARRVVHTGNHVGEAHLGGADGAHAVVDASWTKTPLDDLETAPGAEDHVRNGNAAVLEYELAVAMRSICNRVNIYKKLLMGRMLTIVTVY